MGRFINADALVSTGQGILGNNMFAYCRSNPVCRRDVRGTVEEDCMTGDDKEDLFEHPDGGYSGSSEVISTDYPTGQQNGATGTSNSGQSVYEQLKQCAVTANNSVSGTGHAAGSQKHTAFKNAVDSLGNSNLCTEVSYKNGAEVKYGTKGSVRFDVVVYDAFGKPICAYDYKTGSATLTEIRIKYMQDISGLDIPIYEIR